MPTLRITQPEQWRRGDPVSMWFKDYSVRHHGVEIGTIKTTVLYDRWDWAKGYDTYAEAFGQYKYLEFVSCWGCPSLATARRERTRLVRQLAAALGALNNYV